MNESITNVVDVEDRILNYEVADEAVEAGSGGRDPWDQTNLN